MPIEIRDHTEGVTFEVRVQPGAKKSRILGENEGVLRLAVNAPPVDGAANETVVEFLRDVWGLRRSQIEIISGFKSRGKRILVRTFDPTMITTIQDSGIVES
ncbi:MAG: DUF167 domain-containing protein [Gemmataceae bacterium]|nr:DUF167 domain-containing protein [Gemmataceae bacterium]